MAAGVEYCVFCDHEAMETACLAASGRRSILQSLKAMTEPIFRDIALEQVPVEYKGHFSRGLASARFCAGFEGEACVFALQKSGGPARVEKRAGSCLFCDPVAVGAKVDMLGGVQQIAGALKKMSEAARAQALAERIPADVRADIQALLKPKQRRLGAPPPLAELERRWAPVLAERRSPKPPATAAQKKFYRGRVLADKARGRKHTGRPKERTAPGAAVDNSAPAPPAKRSAKAAGLERWALHYAWAQCEACGSMLARDLTQKSLTRDQKVTAPPSQCPRCRGARDHPAPKLADVPEPLRGLSEEAAQKLSPLEVDVGFEQRAKHGTGYRAHAHMLRLRWKETKVRAAIRELPDKEMRRKTKMAYEYLRQAEDSAYGEFLREHKTFLEEHPEADRTTRRRRLAFLERPGLECALWPTLFWRRDMTFSHERASDPRRQKAETLEAALRPARPERPCPPQHQAPLRGTVARPAPRLHGPLRDPPICLWTDLGSKRNLGTGVPMRLMLAGSTFSPLYWRRVQWGLVDLVRQVGFPKFFYTLSPSEWTLPYHGYVLDGMAKLLRGRLRLPVEETLHIVHVLLQTAKGFLLGDTAPRKDWRDHVFAVRDETGQGRRLHGFVRIEFQDGTRKLPTQEYHGSGRPHLHLLVFGDDDLIRTLDLSSAASATMPSDTDLAGYVRGSQLDHKQDSGRGIFAEENQYVEELRAWRLKHLPEDQETGLRGYLPDVLDALKCHQDLQIGEDKIGMLRQYMTKYLAKFSDSASQEWLNDDADAVSIATTVLSRYHPMEPEMVLQLFGAKFRRWHFTTLQGGKRDFVVPVPDAELPEKHEVRLYEAAAWARGRVSLLDFLRNQRVAEEEARGPGRAGRDLGRFCNPLQGAGRESCGGGVCVAPERPPLRPVAHAPQAVPPLPRPG